MTETIRLPWPPTVNTYWRQTRGRFYVSTLGQLFRQQVKTLWYPRPTLTGKLHVSVTAFPPDYRRRDIDNISKALLDSLQSAGAYEDDYQISRLSLERMEPVVKDGHVIVQMTRV